MLEKILKIMESGNRITVEDLADKLDTTPSMISAMMENLVRQGFLKKSKISAHSHSGTEGSSCAGCSGCCVSSDEESIMEIFELVEKE